MIGDIFEYFIKRADFDRSMIRNSNMMLDSINGTGNTDMTASLPGYDIAMFDK